MKNNITFIKNENLETINDNYKGNMLINGRFTLSGRPKKSHLLKTLKWIFSPNPQKKELIKNKAVTPVTHISTFQKNSIYWLGHSSFYININNITIVTDPVFFDLITNKRDTKLPFDIATLTDIDYILISHDHYDHFSVKSIKALKEKSPNMEALLPLGFTPLFDNCPLKSIPRQCAGWYQKYNIDKDIEIIFLPADHWCRRNLMDENKRLWGSFLIKTKDISIYFAGDTAYNESLFKEIRSIIGKVDIALLPIGSYAPAYMMQCHHTNPEEAYKICQILEADKFIPMHYGTYTMSSEPANEPVDKIRQIVPEDKLAILNIGGKISL